MAVGVFALSFLGSALGFVGDLSAGGQVLCGIIGVALGLLWLSLRASTAKGN
jgi:hypothetical protein